MQLRRTWAVAAAFAIGIILAGAGFAQAQAPTMQRPAGVSNDLQRSAEVPVVIVTGWGVEVPSDQLRQNGVDRVMTKPFRIEDVRDVVASFRPKG